MKFLNFNKVLCLSPHPDDVEYSMGGSIIKSKETHFDVLCLTKGGDFDPSTKTNRFEEITKFWKDTNANNVTQKFSPYEMIKDIGMDEWIHYIEVEFMGNGYDCIFTPSQLDSHFEHEFVSKFGYALIRCHSTSLIEYCSPSTLETWIPNLFVDVSGVYKTKASALKKFKSQLHRKYFDKSVIDGFHIHFPQSKKEMGKVEKFKIQQHIIK